MTGDYSAVGGGRINSIVGSNATIAGGYWNRVSGESSVIVGGSMNQLTGIATIIAGGTGNKVTGSYSAVGGGSSNFITGVSSTIAGGTGNQVTGDYSIVGAGRNNSVGGNYSSILGGQSNIIVSNYSSILGGFSNTTSGNYSLIGAGTNAQIPVGHSGAAIFADGQNRVHQSKYEHSLSLDFASGIYASGDLGVGGTVNALSYVNNPTSKTIFVDAGVGTDNRQLQSVDGKQNSTQLSPYDQFKPFATISGAVAASNASNGDLVVVRAGNYTASSTINLNGKGNLYFEPNTYITTTITDLFTLSANESKQILGYANFIANNTGGLIEQTNGSILFECNSIIGTSTAILFSAAAGSLIASFNSINITGIGSVIFDITGTASLIVRKSHSVICKKFLSANTTSGAILLDVLDIMGSSSTGIITISDHLTFTYCGVSLESSSTDPCIRFAYTANGTAPVIQNVKLKTSGTPIVCVNNGTFRDIFLDNVKINSTNISNPSISSSPLSTTLYSTTTYSNVAPASSVTIDGQYNIMTKIF